MAKWTSVSKIAKTAGKNVDEMSDILKSTGHTFSKSGKSVLGHVSDVVYMDTPRISNITEQSLKNARKTKVSRNKDLESRILKQGDKFELNAKIQKEKDLLVPKPDKEQQDFLKEWRKDYNNRKKQQIDDQTMKNINTEIEKMDVQQLGTNTEASANRQAYRQMREERIVQNKLNNLRETLSEGKANSSIFSKMSDEDFKKQQGRIDELIDKRRKQEHYSSSGTSSKKTTTNTTQQQELLKERLKNKYSNEDVAAFRQNKQKKNTAPKGNPNNWVYKAAGLGVGGAIVFSMANNKGQQSNSQLYGQG